MFLSFFPAYVKNLWYVLKHKYYVFIECCKLGIPFRGIIHDMSKFRPSEYKYYALYFFNKKLPEWDYAKRVFPSFPYKYTKEGVKEGFDIAWLHHHRRNKHHWQYWLEVSVDNNDIINVVPIEMPLKVAKEMLADWRGAGRSITGKDDTFDYYMKNRNKIILHDNTRKWIEEQLGLRNSH